jgi:hypothetical protein
LKLADKRLGLLINFNVVQCRFNQERNHTHREQARGMISRKDARAAKKRQDESLPDR